jgi:hypothetical protein
MGARTNQAGNDDSKDFQSCDQIFGKLKYWACLEKTDNEIGFI